MALPELDPEVAQLLQAIGAEAPGHDAKLALMRSWRRSPEHTEVLDRFVVEQLQRGANMDKALRVARVNLDKLQGLVGKLTAPPLHEAVLRRTETGAGGLLACVRYGTLDRLVTVLDDVDMAALKPGQVVLLADELNAILAVGPPGPPQCGEVATVARAIDGGRLVLSDRDNEVIVSPGGTLAGVAVEPGQRVRWSRELLMAFEPVESDQGRESIVEYLPKASPGVLAGMDGARDRVLRDFSTALVHPELAALYQLDENLSLLLWGPPGCGKTTLARVIASHVSRLSGVRCQVARVNASALESMWVGESERRVRELFKTLNDEDAFSLLFIDEADAIARPRGESHAHHSDKFLSTWLTEIDGLEARNRVGIIAATNRKDLIDPAALERLAAMELFVPRPDMAAARAIFAVHLGESLPYRPNGTHAPATRNEAIETAVSMLYSPNADNSVAKLRFRDGKTREIVARELLSGRVISHICTQARRAAFSRHARGAETGVGVADMQQAVGEAIARMTTTLSTRNVHSHLHDLPQDVDVVAVEPVRRKLPVQRYLRTMQAGA